jgi:hypothetical protein
MPLPPLRTHRAPFNAVGSSTSKALLDRDTRQHFTVLTSRYRPGATKRFRLWAHQLELSLPSSAFPYRSCLSGFLVTRHLLEVCSFSRRANLEPVSMSLQLGLRFLQPPLPAVPSVGLATALPVRENIGLTTACPECNRRVPHEYPRGLEPVLRLPKHLTSPPVVRHLRWVSADAASDEHPFLTTYHFGPSVV